MLDLLVYDVPENRESDVKREQKARGSREMEFIGRGCVSFYFPRFTSCGPLHPMGSKEVGRVIT